MSLIDGKGRGGAGRTWWMLAAGEGPGGDLALVGAARPAVASRRRPRDASETERGESTKSVEVELYVNGRKEVGQPTSDGPNTQPNTSAQEPSQSLGPAQKPKSIFS